MLYWGILAVAGAVIEFCTLLEANIGQKENHGTIWKLV